MVRIVRAAVRVLRRRPRRPRRPIEFSTLPPTTIDQRLDAARTAADLMTVEMLARHNLR